MAYLIDEIIICMTSGLYIKKNNPLELNICVVFGAGEGNRTLVSTLARSRSTIELHLQLAVQTRIELAISSVTGRHVNHYTTGP